MNDTLKRNHPPRELVDEHGTSPDHQENVCVSFFVSKTDALMFNLFVCLWNLMMISGIWFT